MFCDNKTSRCEIHSPAAITNVKSPGVKKGTIPQTRAENVWKIACRKRELLISRGSTSSSQFVSDWRNARSDSFTFRHRRAIRVARALSSALRRGKARQQEEKDEARRMRSRVRAPK